MEEIAAYTPVMKVDEMTVYISVAKVGVERAVELH